MSKIVSAAALSTTRRAPVCVNGGLSPRPPADFLTPLVQLRVEVHERLYPRLTSPHPAAPRLRRPQSRFTDGFPCVSHHGIRPPLASDPRLALEDRERLTARFHPHLPHQTVGRPAQTAHEPLMNEPEMMSNTDRHQPDRFVGAALRTKDGVMEVESAASDRMAPGRDSPPAVQLHDRILPSLALRLPSSSLTLRRIYRHR